MKINWKIKLSSRKFWAALIGIITAVLALVGTDELTTEKVVALVSAEGTLAAYIFTEGKIDCERLCEEDEEIDGQ